MQHWNCLILVSSKTRSTWKEIEEVFTQFNFSSCGIVAKTFWSVTTDN